jgi:hypothetical protein
MLLQAIIGASLETLEYFCIGSHHLAIALWMSNERVVDLHPKVFSVPLEGTAGELGPIISDDSVRDPKPTDDGLDELDCELIDDFDHKGRFRPLGEFVDGDVEIPVPSDGPGKWSQDVQPPHSELS